MFVTGFVDTGDMDSAMIDNSSLWSRESTFRVLRGPKTSVVVFWCQNCEGFDQELFCDLPSA